MDSLPQEEHARRRHPHMPSALTPPRIANNMSAPAQMMKADSMDVLAEERDREVRNILTSIADLAQIMKDLSTLVIDQGTVLDRIDYNMEQARPLFLISGDFEHGPPPRRTLPSF